MPLYHAIQHVFLPRQVIAGSGGRAAYPEIVPALDAQRPDAFPRRDDCVFCADSIDAATSFASGQQIPHSNIRVYEVKVLGAAHTGPMALIHALQRKFVARLNLDNLVREYWSPAHSWTFLETIGASFEVVTQVPTASSSAVLSFKTRYERDVDQATEFDTWRSTTNRALLTRFSCIARDGRTRHFLFDSPIKDDGPPVRVRLRVRAELQNSHEEFMELELVKEGPALLRIQTIHHHHAADLKHMGIPEVLLPC